MTKAQRILVTGGAGFIGSHLVEKLIRTGFKVLVLDNFDDYYDPEEKMANLRWVKNSKNFELVKGDIRDKKLLKKIFFQHKIDGVVHLAAKAGVRPSINDPSGYADVNYLGTLSLLEIIKNYKIRNFIFGSSSSVYGERSKIPFKETDRTDKPISPYGATKAAAEQICFTYHHLYGIPITCLRFFTVYGPRQRPDLAIRKFIDLIYRGEEIPIFGDGLSERDYTFIDDIIEGIFRSLQTPFGYEIINLGNSGPVGLKELVRMIEKGLGKKAKTRWLPYQSGDVTKTFADIKKAKKLLNWEPSIRFEDGLKKTIDWYLGDYGEKS